MPNVWAILRLLVTVYKGRTAGSGYSAEIVGCNAAQPRAIPETVRALATSVSAQVMRVHCDSAER